MYELLNHMDLGTLDKLEEPEALLELVKLLLNKVEDLSSKVSALEKENQALKDENNRLKGEQGLPDFGREKPQGSDVSSGGKEKGVGKKPRNNRQGRDRDRISVDRREVHDLEASDLPADAQFKYWDEVIQQDLKLVRDNVLHQLAVYYSASERKTYRASLPKDYVGHFGVDLQCLLHILHHTCNVTHKGLLNLLHHGGISISAGSVSNILMSASEWALSEQQAILAAGISGSGFTQSDSTSNKEKGHRKTTHIVCGDYFSVFYTLASKARLDVLRSLQGQRDDELQLAYTAQTFTYLEIFKVSVADKQTLARLFEGAGPCSLTQFDHILQQEAPEIYAKPNITTRIRDAFALGYYHHQQAFPVVERLLSDDAPEYKKIALRVHALCWVHDARFYNKLFPRVKLHQDKLKAFQDQYWTFYGQLLDYKSLPSPQQTAQKPLLEKEFERIFTQQTDFFQLDALIEATYAKKAKLLAVLDCPALPLHNNAAELAARRIVRKRDISFHTWSAKGTQVRDALLSIIETANKLGISALDYIKDRVAKTFEMPSLAQSIDIVYQNNA